MTAKITTEGLTELNKQTGIDKKDSDDVAQQWLDDNSFKVVKRVAKTGPTITVGSGDFGETITLANIYADWLQRNGYPVKKKLDIGSREIYFPALQRGEIDLVPEYAGTLLTYLKSRQPGDHRSRHERAHAGDGARAAEAHCARTTRRRRTSTASW